jgi:hypothetical protein
MPATLTAATALAHERLCPRVAALLGQVERLAVRHPAQPVPPATLSVAEGLFGEARRVLGREAGGVGRGADDLGSLAVGLGQLAARLAAFEAAHSGWSPEAGAVVWHVGGTLPVARLQPRRPVKGVSPPQPLPRGARAKVLRRLVERENLRYMQGYRDGAAGRPPIPPLTQAGPIPEA